MYGPTQRCGTAVRAREREPTERRSLDNAEEVVWRHGMGAQAA